MTDNVLNVSCALGQLWELRLLGGEKILERGRLLAGGDYIKLLW